MKKIIQISFVVSVLVIFSLPVFFFDKKSKISVQENRNLAEKPYIFSENRINENIFKDYDNYLNDRFGGRQKFIALNKAVNTFLRSNALNFNEKAIQGKDGWCFYLGDENLSDFYKTNLFDESQKMKFAKNVKNTADWCKSQNIPCIFMVLPNKHSVYPEFYPFKRPEGITRSDQIAEIFENIGVNWIFPRDYLISKKSEYDFPLYYETGTHWNQKSALLTAEILWNKISELLPDAKFPDVKYKIEKIEKDTYDSMLSMLNLPPAEDTRLFIKPSDCEFSDLYEYIRNDGAGGVETKSKNPKLPRLLVFRDSFFIALEPFVSPLFSQAEYRWKRFTEEDEDYVLKYKPDIIIFESVERYSPEIVQCN